MKKYCLASFAAILIFFSCIKRESGITKKELGNPKLQQQLTQGQGCYPLICGNAIRPYGTQVVSRVTGPTPPGETLPNPNNTLVNYGLGETDIGVMWENSNHQIMTAFGDNFGSPRNGPGFDTWKSNALAFTSDSNLSDGLTFSGMLMNNGQLAELVHRETGETTNIPTGGVSVGSRNYIYYMAVNQWARNGNYDDWSLFYGQIAYSDDNGTTWTKSGVKWGSTSNFAQAYYLKKDGMIYMFGTPSGRLGDVYLAKVSEANILSQTSYDYWNGSAWVNNNEAAAQPIALGPVSAEMSVIYNSYWNRYFMIYLSVKRRAIVMRDAADVTGEWSEEKVVSEDNGNAVYAPYFHPWYNNGSDLYYFVSYARQQITNEQKYNIFLYHTSIDGGILFNMLSEPGFEELPSLALGDSTHWKVPNSVASTDAHSGGVSCKLTNNTAGQFKDAAVQTVAVKPNTNYVIKAWAKSSLPNVTGAYFGVRKPNGGIADTNPTITNTGWTQLVYFFNSGNNTKLDVFYGVWGYSGLDVYLDDVTLQLQ